MPSSTMKFASHQQAHLVWLLLLVLRLWKGREEVSLTCVVVSVLVVLGRREEGSVCQLVLQTFLHLLPVCQRGHDLCRTRAVTTVPWGPREAKLRPFVRQFRPA